MFGREMNDWVRATKKRRRLRLLYAYFINSPLSSPLLDMYNSSQCFAIASCIDWELREKFSGALGKFRGKWKEILLTLSFSVVSLSLVV